MRAGNGCVALEPGKSNLEDKIKYSEMREMNPMHPQSDDQLSKALRRLAANSNQGAPPELGEMLKGKFHQRHARRKRMKTMGFIGLAACLAVFTMLLLSRKPTTPTPGPHTPSETAQVTKPSENSIPSGPAVSPASQQKTSRLRPPRTTTTASATRDDEFFALPSYHPAMPTNEWQIVRLELTGAELRMVGAPVTEEFAQRRVRADFLVGRDGTPYGVRLVQ